MPSRKAKSPSALLRRASVALLCMSLLLAWPVRALQAQEGQPAVHFTLVVSLPDATAHGDPIYLSTDHDGWRADDPKYRLQPRPDGRWELKMSAPADRLLHFLFCRGSWARVEVRADGSSLDARRLRPRDGASYELRVARWADADMSTITGHVESFVEPSFLHGRHCWVYLPPGYAEGDRRYPVLYMHDGQNLFDKERSYAGEWQLDETLERMIAGKELPALIVVGIENGGVARMDEYGPWHDTKWNAGGGGDAYLRAVADTLKPAIDAHYRTLSKPQHTYMAGSSLGGLISAYAGFKYGKVFGGGIAAVSPSYWWAQDRILQLAQRAGRPTTRRFYQDMGTLESGGFEDENNDGVEDSIGRLRAMRDLLVAGGMKEGKNLLSVEAEGGRHHERDWAKRLPRLLRFLLADE
ncbi:MAG TPA: alpha/beta hydrolase-fold protein [Candidatus Krumholzibacteria bacterium]|nr:alpha/beta hydrolase-fold protein [Candidatus Krumholzibacteria bacterium]